jgi:hypothetical protein
MNLAHHRRTACRLGFHESRFFFTFDEIEIPKKFYPNFVIISMFRFYEISISMSQSEFRFRLFTFDEIKIPRKFHTDFAEISMSKSDFRFRFWCWNRNSESDFDFWFGISIPTSDFRFRYNISIQMWNFKVFRRNKSTILFGLLIGISISTVKIEIEIPITVDNLVESRN